MLSDRDAGKAATQELAQPTATQLVAMSQVKQQPRQQAAPGPVAAAAGPENTFKAHHQWAVLQVVMIEGCMEERRAKKLVGRVCGDTSGEENSNLAVCLHAALIAGLHRTTLCR
jgi:hypothetical protein